MLKKLKIGDKVMRITGVRRFNLAILIEIDTEQDLYQVEFVDGPKTWYSRAGITKYCLNKINLLKQNKKIVQ